MPKFLLVTILIFVLAGHIFAVKEDSGENQLEPEIENVSSIEDLYFSENYDERNIPLQIIEGPSGDLLDGNSQTVFIDNGENCIFFEKDGIPRVDNCPNDEKIIKIDTKNNLNNDNSVKSNSKPEYLSF